MDSSDEAIIYYNELIGIGQKYWQVIVIANIKKSAASY